MSTQQDRIWAPAGQEGRIRREVQLSRMEARRRAEERDRRARREVLRGVAGMFAVLAAIIGILAVCGLLEILIGAVR